MKYLSLIVIVALLAACTTQPITEKAGQGTNHLSTSAFNSASSNEQPAHFNGGTSGASEGVEIPMLDKDGKPVLDKDGKPVSMRLGRGLRDVNFFFGETRISAETTVSGTNTGSSQDATPSTNISPPVNVSGIPGVK